MGSTQIRAKASSRKTSISKTPISKTPISKTSISKTSIHKTSIRQTGSPTVARLTESGRLPDLRIDPVNPSPPELPQRKHSASGAMAQQSGNSGAGNQCAPQKLLQLVGCREQKAAPKHSISTKL